MIANVVNGEVGPMCGTILMTYFDGSQEYVDGTYIRKIHARVLDNQVKSDVYPDTLRSCISRYWSKNYLDPSWGTSEQWLRSRADAVDALDNYMYVPNNLFGATCDSRFDKKYPKFMRWARVDWDTGWNSGTFYYYTYGYPEYDEIEEEDEPEWSAKLDIKRKDRLTM